MADFEYQGDAPVSDGIISQAMNWLGAGTAVALVAGLGVWGYQLAVRDVSAVPVIEALEGPARIQPEDPGGQLAQHQGLAINRVQSDGEAEGPVPKVILAPAPIDLAAEDVAGAQREPIEIATRTEDDTAVSDLVAAVADGSEPLGRVPGSAAIDAAIGQVLVSLQAAPAQIDPAIPGVRRSSRPLLRPATQRAVLRNDGQLQSSAPLQPASLTSGEDSDQIPAGTRLVQLGAFDDTPTAQAAWDEIAAQFTDYIGGKSAIIQEAQSGGRVFYRLRVAGFENLSASRRFCAVLVAANADCIPVLAR